MWQCLSVVDNVMFLMLNKDKDFEIGTSQTTKQTKKNKRRHLKQRKNKKRQLTIAANSATSTCLESHPLLSKYKSTYIRHLSVWDVVVCVGLFVCKLMCAGEHPAQSHHYDPTLRHHDRLCHMTGREPEVDRTMLLVLAISLRDNKRQQKGFQRKYSSIALYPLNLGYWFKYETCTPQEK